MAVIADIALGTDSTREPPLNLPADDFNGSSVVLTLCLDDPDVVAELVKRKEGAPRIAYAASALRIGVLALRQAEGHIDAEIVRTEGQRLIGDLNRELAKGIGEIDSRISTSLKLYFDPNSGHFTERVERLVRKDGDLERVLRQQIGDGENSELARALARRIGKNSPLMRRLDPHDTASITKSIEQSVTDVLDRERDRILSEFSLDNQDGALTRVVNQIKTANEQLKVDVELQIQGAVREFSLDDEGSALSRLVRKVEEAKNQITEEFSLDNECSAINKLNHVLVETKRSITENLTLDDEQSALARLKSQLTAVLDEIRAGNEKFQQDVSTKLATLITKHQEEMRSTTHGLSFEDEFCAFLQREAQRAGDVFTATGSTTGSIPKCKIGDGVIEISAEAAAAGERIVFEAKGNKSYTLDAARTEIDQARKNRGAAVGVFVFAKESAPQGLLPFTRIDHDLFVIWDSEDQVTDVYLSAAVSVAKALLFRQKSAQSENQGDLDGIERAVNILEKQMAGLDEMEKWTSTIQSNSGKIAKEIVKIRDVVREQIEQLRDCLDALRAIE